MKKPQLSFWQIWNMSVGFLGIQMGFALQNGNASRILQSFGADVHELSWFWIVAPLTGMIVQPIIGYYSDRTWTWLGRRRPFFLTGAVLAAIGLLLMPNAGSFAHVLPSLWIGAGMLMIMDASFNVAMEPFRALVADKLPSDQRTLGYSLQTVLIGVGAVVGSWLPYVLGEWFGVKMSAEEGMIPQNVIMSFFIGAAVLVITVLWTIIKTPEYSPTELATFDDHEDDEDEGHGLSQIFVDIKNMPQTMKQLGLVQFFSWFALFSMWVFTTPAVAQHAYGLAPSDTHSDTFQEAGNWVGVIFGVYNLISAIYAFFLPTIALRLGRKNTHAMSLVCGGLGLISMYFFRDPSLLIISMVGIGIAWASILAMPYAILAGSIPAKKMGIYMGIFNLFITVPQIVSSVGNGFIVNNVFNNYAIYAILMAGVFMLIAAFCVRFVDDVDEVVA
jgi:maltose/moltooligosaccharide transporter